ncbi:hypothetical protein BDK51DRAFT_38147 [Blyttiomyces helicus]|uniref:HAD-like domain-containing protein n=1 Tax=Blyttiomyces helicus TaxID=388810 RepID=A0A4P9VVA8_9FUNG|nr:hypothetical protein BDK51DRAFT_38147 [Blyttiomyces helicus]|eukprot:RKO83569.1 hypothetical protein BDK51DRAFT_38147 [Blyttiomyces helicus]
MSSAAKRLVTFDAFGTLFKMKYPPGEVYASAARKHGCFVDEKAVGRDLRAGKPAHSTMRSKRMTSSSPISEVGMLGLKDGGGRYGGVSFPP